MDHIIAIINIIKTSAALDALLGDRIYPVLIPQGTAYPAMVVATSGLIPYDTKSGKSDFDSYQVQIDILSEKYTEMATLHRLCNLAMDRAAPGVYNAVNVSGIRKVGVRDLPWEQEIGLYRVSIDYQIIISY